MLDYTLHKLLICCWKEQTPFDLFNSAQDRFRTCRIGRRKGTSPSVAGRPWASRSSYLKARTVGTPSTTCLPLSRRRFSGAWRTGSGHPTERLLFYLSQLLAQWGHHETLIACEEGKSMQTPSIAPFQAQGPLASPWSLLTRRLSSHKRRMARILTEKAIWGSPLWGHSQCTNPSPLRSSHRYGQSFRLASFRLFGESTRSWARWDALTTCSWSS